MKHDYKYHSPTIEIIAVDAESVLCASMVFGNEGGPGKDYFDELLERIREIRASERRAYQKITDIFEQCSYDYDKNSESTKKFYAFVQNKLHFAVKLGYSLNKSTQSFPVK